MGNIYQAIEDRMGMAGLGSIRLDFATDGAGNPVVDVSVCDPDGIVIFSDCGFETFGEAIEAIEEFLRKQSEGNTTVIPANIAETETKLVTLLQTMGIEMPPDRQGLTLLNLFWLRRKLRHWGGDHRQIKEAHRMVQSLTMEWIAQRRLGI